MESIILESLRESITVKEKTIRAGTDLIIRGARMLAECMASGHKVLIFGNGGSAADAQHIAAEFVNRFKIERSPLAAIALTTDTSILTSIGNDYDFDLVFSKQIRALGKKHDIAWGISTSGNSKNVVEAIETAKRLELITIGMTGTGGRLADCAELVYTVPSEITAHIQETHITIAHMLCDLVDRILFPNEYK
ncbi:MAG TPA: D-sedoheptulose 7-phosphate isomerase [Deltaproteobacteria bacterium]|nr:D-sedoheptulose 7-phosphate isomerase [Deltaproteobacteria bacterium]